MIITIKKINNYTVEFIEKIKVTNKSLKDVGINDFKDYSFHAENMNIKVYLNTSYYSLYHFIEDEIFLTKIVMYYENLDKSIKIWKKRNEIILNSYMILLSIVVTLLIKNLFYTTIAVLLLTMSYLITLQIFLPTKNLSNELTQYIQDKIKLHRKILLN